MALICDTGGVYAIHTQYRDLNVGIADASVVATAERLGIQRLLTVDQRHFRAITPRHWSHFVILPSDASGSN